MGNKFINYLQLILLQKKIVNQPWLNHQIEHHIFPIYHIHYGNIAKIVKETAAECTLPKNTKQCSGAVIAHFKHLKDLGMKPAM
jgi:linoleoyl-CoA desaturase